MMCYPDMLQARPLLITQHHRPHNLQRFTPCLSHAHHGHTTHSYYYNSHHLHTVPSLLLCEQARIGACCYANATCGSNVEEALCRAAGGTFNTDPNACGRNGFCAGACCTGGNTAQAYCRTTVKADCPASGNWQAGRSCFEPNFCPRVRRLPYGIRGISSSLQRTWQHVASL